MIPILSTQILTSGKFFIFVEIQSKKLLKYYFYLLFDLSIKFPNLIFCHSILIKFFLEQMGRELKRNVKREFALCTTQ